MKIDPIMSELYATKESLAAKHHFDLHALAESFRRSPSWKPVKKPARIIRTAKERLKRLTQEDEILRELRAVKEAIAAENGYDVHRIAAAARAFARKHPILASHKIGQLRDQPGSGQVRSNGSRLQRNTAVKPKKQLRKPSAFRTSTMKGAAKHRRDEHEA